MFDRDVECDHALGFFPNKKLRALYTAMVELRLLEEFVTTQQRKAKRKLFRKVQKKRRK